ncbi:hypothetical protein KSS87_013269 [Heliosperma pusillum]|nr:hypothetical protein KSS87_013269 [Heliosperma pusillum]
MVFISAKLMERNNNLPVFWLQNRWHLVDNLFLQLASD